MPGPETGPQSRPEGWAEVRSCHRCWENTVGVQRGVKQDFMMCCVLWKCHSGLCVQEGQSGATSGRRAFRKFVWMSREDLVAGIGLVVAEIELCTGSAQDLLLNRTEVGKSERKHPCLLGVGLEDRTHDGAIDEWERVEDEYFYRREAKPRFPFGRAGGPENLVLSGGAELGPHAREPLE